MTGKASIALVGASISHGQRIVLNEVTLRIEPGESVGLLGPNGAGKTSLLRALIGLIKPRSGTILTLGRPAQPGRAGIAYLPQQDPEGAFLSGFEIVAAAIDGAALTPPWHNRHASARRVEEALAKVGATALAGRRFRTLSGGEKRRIVLARAIAARPKLMLLDEPLASLDPAAQTELATLLGTVRRELGCTMLISSHELNPLLPVIDRVLYIGQGQAALGSVDQVVTAPVLSRLYGAPVAVLRDQGRIFVLPGSAPEMALH